MHGCWIKAKKEDLAIVRVLNYHMSSQFLGGHPFAGFSTETRRAAVGLSPNHPEKKPRPSGRRADAEEDQGESGAKTSELRQPTIQLR